MIKIKGAQRTRFAKLYRQVLREKHLTSSQIAKRIGLGKRSVYNTASLSNTKAITLKRAMRVLKGLPLTKSRLNALVRQIIHGKSSKSAKYSNKNKRLNQAAKAKLNGMSAPKAAQKYHVGISTIYRYAKLMRKNQPNIEHGNPHHSKNRMVLRHKAMITQIKRATMAKLNGMKIAQAAKKYHVGKSTIYKYARSMKRNHASVKQIRPDNSNQKRPQQLSLQPINENKTIGGDNVKNHSVERSIIQKALKRWDHGTVVLYKPIHNHKPSPLAEDIKNHMANEQMNMKTLTYRTGLNHKRLHEFFNGKRQVLPRLTIFRLALGLNLRAHNLLQMNHANVQISKSIVSEINHPVKQNKQEPSHTLSRQLINLIKKLDDNDVKLILPIAERLLKSER